MVSDQICIPGEKERNWKIIPNVLRTSNWGNINSIDNSIKITCPGFISDINLLFGCLKMGDKINEEFQKSLWIPNSHATHSWEHFASRGPSREWERCCLPSRAEMCFQVSAANLDMWPWAGNYKHLWTHFLICKMDVETPISQDRCQYEIKEYIKLSGTCRHSSEADTVYYWLHPGTEHNIL